MRKVSAKLLWTVLMCIVVVPVYSQATGDFRSKQNGDWSNAASWETFNGTSWVNAATFPLASNGSISIRNGHTIAIQSATPVSADQLVVDAGGVLTITFTLNLADGSGDDLTVHGTLDFSGTLNGPGNLVISSAGTINFPAFFDSFLGASLTNNGIMNWQGAGRIWAMANITITNNNTFTITSNSTFLENGVVQSTFINNGTINKNSGAQTEFTNAIFNNTGTIHLNAGIWRNTAGFTNTAVLNLNGGGWLNASSVDAFFVFNTGSVISGTGSFDNSGLMQLNINIVLPATVNFVIGSHTSIIDGAGNLTINNDLAMQGTIGGAGSLTVNGNITWSSGMLARILTVGAGRSLAFVTGNPKLIGANLTNNGTMNWQEGPITVTANISIINNGLFSINTDHNFSGNSITDGTLINSGTIMKNSAGNTNISVANVTNNAAGIIKGIGTIALGFATTFTSNGTIAPGLSPGMLVFNSSPAQLFSSGSTLSIEIAGNGGAGNPTGHDQLQRIDHLTLNGNLTITETGAVPDGDYTIISLPSTITGTFSSVNLPANYSVIYNTNSVVARKGTVCPASLTIAASPGDAICSGTNASFTATPTNGGTPFFQWKLNGNNVGSNSNTYSNNILVNGDQVSCVMTSSLGCANPNTAISNTITMAVNATVAPSVSIGAAPGNTICAGTNVTFAATPTNGGASPSYQWKLNGNNVGTNSNTYSNNGLINGDIVTVVMTSNSTCASPTTATSTGITMVVISTVVPSVNINANPGNTICAGTNVTFTATPTNGGTPSYQWKLNGNNVGTNSVAYSNNALVNGDIVTVVMTSSLACANPTTATSSGITMNVTSTVTPSVSISANPGNTVCSGISVTFTATPTHGGTPSYQWKLNGNNVGTNSNQYTNAGLVNGDQVSCVMTSNASCASPTTATSNTISMAVTSTVIPSVSITADPGNTICTGASVTFTATPTNGGTPSYQWKLNGNNVGTNSNQYTNAGLINGDQVSCVMTSSLACASPTTATSNTITIAVTATVVPSVSIAANPGNTICAGVSVSFTATPTNGGTPSYQWKLNGNNVGTNSNQYTNAGLVSGDQVSCVMSSSLACASPTTATSNTITMAVTATVVPSVTIGANPGNTVCAGTNVTFTATPTNGGTSPSYQWRLNGINVGINSNTYSNNGLVNGDIVTVVLTSNATCASPATATSGGITMVVTSAVVPSVNINASPGNTICTGTNVTFTGIPINGGATPSYQWKLNGNNVGTNNNTYSNNALANADIVTVVMTSSLACANPVTATSANITMNVTSTVTPAVSISASPGNTICSATNVTFTATPTNGGASPSYQWKLNGNNVGTNSVAYSNNALVNGDMVTVVMTSSLACASPASATSTGITMIVTSTVTPSVSISANPGNTICSGTNVTFTATPTNSGTPSYQWKLNGSSVGTNSSTYSNNSLATGNVVTVQMTSSIACASPATATSNSITMTVNAPATYYRDQDGDGYGNPVITQQSCTVLSGYVSNNTDCDDNNAAVNPGVAEICGNGIDDNCNGQTDENCTADLPAIILRTYPVKEGDAGMTVIDIEVKLDRPAPLQVRVNYFTSNDDAIAGQDYVATQGVLIIPAGGTSGIVRINIIGDRIRENNERFWLNFSHPVNVIIGGEGQSRIMIIDDERGKPGSIITRVQPWRVPVSASRLDEVMVFNQQGVVVYKAMNVNNNISLAKLSTGTYYYVVRAKDKTNKVQKYEGMIVLME